MTAAHEARLVAPAPGTTDPGPRDHADLAVWAPRATAVELRVRRDGAETVTTMERGADGWHRAPSVRAVPGDRYAYRLDADGPWLPDPRSLHQPDGVHGDSEVHAPAPDPSWTGRDLRGGTIYELHVGTFAPGPDGASGTLDTAISRLDHLVALGVDAVELMPVAAFPGERGWGYDGVDLYATHAAYGGPAALERFVAAAHERGLAVVMDVVMNHLGPAGNYLSAFAPYFTDTHETPWGPAVNLDADGSAEVRAFLLGLARHWLVDMGLDGLRLDAVHALRDDSDRHLLAELADAVASWSAALGRPLTLIAESDLNDPRMVTPTADGGLGMDMQWADDIHHAVHAWSTGERDGYYGDFGSAEVLARCVTRMFEHAGTFSTFRGQVWGSPVDPTAEGYDAHSFVAFLQDHDQVGNRAVGDRPDATTPLGVHAAAAALILCGPATVMLFQGEEWAASTPFTFFTDHDDELGPLVSAGRAEEFAQMGWSGDIPDPQDRATFEAAMLDWSEAEHGDHARMLAWYTELLALRRAEADLRDPDLRRVDVEILSEETVVLRRGRIRVLAHRGEGPIVLPDEGGAEVLARFDTDPETADADALALRGQGAIVFRCP